MCLVAFQKIFRKIFSGVWKRRRKRQTQKNSDKTQKKKSSTIDARLGSTARCFASSSLTTAPSIAISRRRDRNRRRDLAKHRADRNRRDASQDSDLGSRLSDWSSRDRHGLELGVRQRSSDWTGAQSSSSHVLALSLSLSLSLSLFFRKYFEVKMKV